MFRRLQFPLALVVAIGALITIIPREAHAQFGGGAGGGGGGAPGGAPGSAGKDAKEEGPAEKAPENQADSPALQPLPEWPQQKEKSLQFIELHGYLRFRWFFFHDFNMGSFGPVNQPSASNQQQAPFPAPYSNTNPNNGTTAVKCTPPNIAGCGSSNLNSADMRFRLEPTINVTQQVRIHAQIDVFDNMVLGSTPEGYYLNGIAAAAGQRLAFNSMSQQSPQSGVNSTWDSVRAKRAWAEVKTPFGELKFGRMPMHWGLGMFFNNGDCLDCDYGQNVDRIMFETKMWKHFFALMWDWHAIGPTTQIIGGQQSQGSFYNADTLDDSMQWMLAVGKKDEPEELKEKLQEGKMVFNYGLLLMYRQQNWDQNVNSTLLLAGNQSTTLQSNAVPRNAKLFVPDVWLRFNYQKLSLEFESAMQVGTIGNLSDFYSNLKSSTQILSGAFAFKGRYTFLRDSLKIFFETGLASGDDADSVTCKGGTCTDNGAVNFIYANRPPVNGSINRFNFDPDYIVDQILFRRILGAVGNAAYFKPGIAYDIIDNFGGRLDVEYALAARPQGYPGNATNLGLELDTQLYYKNEEEGFYAGLMYGVLFPFNGLDYPPSIFATPHGSEITQAVQARLVVKF